VKREGEPWPDWRDPAQYRGLADADPSLIAWEWLRRDPAYRIAAAGQLECSKHFGLVRFERPDLGVPIARPLWRSGLLPYVLHVSALAEGDERFDLDEMRDVVSLVADEAGDRLLLSNGYRALRLDAPPGTFGTRKVHLRYHLDGLERAGRPLLTLRRFLALCRTGTFSSSLHPRGAIARRSISLLRAWDAILAGADQRDIAKVLISSSAAEARWRSREPSSRSRAQRLVRSARKMAGGGYRSLLQHP
jgi:hypothetical protein